MKFKKKTLMKRRIQDPDNIQDGYLPEFSPRPKAVN